MKKLIRINMNVVSAVSESVPDSYDMLGGKSLTSRIVFDEVDPLCDPLGPYNKLVVAPGLLGGTQVPCSGRLSVGGKSPMTGGIKESNAGGTAARALAKLGVKAIILEGKSESGQWWVLKISSDSVALLPADDLIGKGNYETVRLLRERFGPKCAVMSIGQAGEQGMAAASIAVSTSEGYASRHCGRGGMGAVMGSKGIKAIVIDDSNATEKDALCEIADEAEFRSACKEWSKELIATKSLLTNLGTTGVLGIVNKLGSLPTQNFRRGQFEFSEEICGEKLKATVLERGGKTGHACSAGCVIRCSNIYKDRDGEYLTSGLEYETIVLMGSNLLIHDLDVIATLDRMCDDFGLDTIDTGGAIGVAMEAGLLPFGDGEKAILLLSEVGKGSIIGKVIGQGALLTAKVLNVTHVASSKGQQLAGYDPRGFKGTGVAYATSPMGGDHTAGNMLPGRGAWRGIEMNSQKENQIMASVDVQYMTAALDSLGLCIFTGPVPESMKWIAKIMTFAFGRTFSARDVVQLGIENINTEIEFNKRAGIKNSTHRMSEFIYKEPLMPNGFIFDLDKREVEEALELENGYVYGNGFLETYSSVELE